MANQIQAAPWKISFVPTGNGPYAVKVKLYDLLFDASGGYWYLTDVGINLPHDILIFDPQAYTTSGGGQINTAGDINTVEARRSHGIYLTKVTYDNRAPAVWTTNPAYSINNVVGDSHYNLRGYYTYNTSAALPPIESDYSVSANKTYYDITLASTVFSDLLDPTKPYNSATNPYMCYASSVSAAITGLPAASNAALILSSPDLALQTTIPGSSLQPYTRIYLRADITNSEIVSILRFFTSYGINNDGSPISAEYGANALIDPTKNLHLLDVEVWVRCAFFADYITPTTFSQDLTTASQVAHNNLILGQGDFARFTRNAVSVDSPYLPMTPPRNDVLKIATVANAGSFPIPPVTGTYNSPTTVSSVPAGWANPDLQKAAGTSVIPAGLIALPALGNAYVSGRIFSPTIDEIWIYIKKLVDGQGTGTTASTSAEPAISLPGNNTGDPISSDGTIFVAAPASITYAVDPTLQTILNAILPNSYAGYVPTVNPTPRTNPYSIRELESLIDNLQYNVRTAAAWAAANAAKTGNINTTIGTLYQMHANYLPTNITTSQWTVANTYNAADSAANYGTALPQATNYDRTTNFLAGDSYLSADGQWHYLFDHIRIPILAETY